MTLSNADPTLFGNDQLYKPKKQLEDYVDAVELNSVFFTSMNPDVIEEKLLKTLKDEGVKDVTIHKDKYKIKFEKIEYPIQKVSEKEQAKIEDAVMIQVRINKVSESMVAVQFQRLRGTKIAFINNFKQYQ